MTADRSLVAERAADTALRARILTTARGWIGTPYLHQASCRGAGTDCLGLLRGVWREIHGAEPEALPPYAPDWGETGRGGTGAGEDLLAAARRHLVPLPPDAACAGDVLVFRMREAGPAKHVGILSSPWLEPGRIIHAYSGHRVCETHLTPPWLRRIAGVFRYPACPATDGRP